MSNPHSPQTAPSAEADRRLMVAAQALQSGDAASAESVARSVVRSHPRHETARMVLARAQRMQGQNKQAIQSCRDGLKVLPNSVNLLIEQALAQRASGRLEDAERSYQDALRRAPGNLLARHNLANLLQTRGAYAEAEPLYREVIAVEPRMVQAHFELGNVLATQGNKAAAKAAWQQAVQLQPNLAQAWINLGHELHAEDLEAAIDAFKRGLSINPRDASALAILSALLTNVGRPEEGERCALMAIDLEPELAMAHHGLGWALHVRGMLRESLAPLDKALSLTQDPALNFESAHLKTVGHITLSQLTEAEAMVNRMEPLARNPMQQGVFHHMKGARLLESGLSRDAHVHFRQAALASPSDVEHRITYCATSHYCDDLSAEALRDMAITQLGSIRPDLSELGDTPDAASARPPRPADGKIRLGFLSGDFRQHSCAYFLGQLLPHLDRERFELFAYYTHPRSDDVTQQIRSWFPHWREVANQKVAELVRTIRQDQLDVLVDLAGLTEGGRIEALAARPAPVQISWLGFLGTTGHPAVQYRLTDGWIDSPDHDSLATEQAIRLDRPYICYQPHQLAPDIQPAPMLTKGHPTFGSFNALTKLSDACVSLWCDVLKAVPDARLLLKTRSLADAQVQRQTLARFTRQGIAAERVELMGWAPLTDSHLSLYNRIDVALDTSPYNGVTTTCESLWMGVPVVSLVGQPFASRQGLSLLNGVGMPELATTSREAYVQKCVDLVANPQALSALRPVLRERMKQGPLTDGMGFTRAFEQAIIHTLAAHHDTT